MERFGFLLASASAIAMAGTAHAQTGTPTSDATALPPLRADPKPPASNAPSQQVPAETPAPDDANIATPASDAGQQTDIVVTGVRRSLERAAQIKQNAVQVVDSIVAQDIGKLPDPTTAAALQRIPGIQVSVNRNNELADVRVRGLPDILTTVNGREVFTTTDRTFSLQDVPAEALARVDAYKSQTADLIEGGLAGILDLQLNKPFNFRDPTAVVSARGNYGVRDERVGPQLGLLLANRWDTPIGEIGLLANGTYSRQDYTRSTTTLNERRSSQTTPFNLPGLLLPNVVQYFPQQGYVERQQFNAAAQWQVTPAIQAYADGLYTYFRDRGALQGVGFAPYTPSFGNASVVSLSNVVPGGSCITTRANAAGQNPAISTAANNGQTLAAFTQQALCQPDSVTFSNIALAQSSNARDLNTRNKQIGGGVSYDQDGWKANVDVAFQRSRNFTQNTVINLAQRLRTVTVNLGDDGVPNVVTPNEPLVTTDNLIIRQAFQQNFSLSNGTLFQAKADLEREFNSSFLKNLNLGARYASRAADFQAVNTNPTVPAPNAGGASPNFGSNEANLVPYNSLGLPANALQLSALMPNLNGGVRALVPSTDFLLSESGLNQIRAFFKLPLSRPGFDPARRFDASEKTIAGFAQATYDVALGGGLTLDGVVGARLIQTDRVFDGFQLTTANGVTTLVPLHSDTSDRDILPAVTARLKSGGFQVRAGYQKSIRRPDFTDLNPAVNLTLSANPLVQNTATAGNPNLKEQKSDSYDATLEYYFRGGYIAVAGYYRGITNRVITSPAIEVFNGVEFRTSRPRNVGQATLKGIEASGQYFLDFLPGALSGVGLQGSFTYSDSDIGGTDVLRGLPLQGVSKYNYTAGLLYEKFGVSGRLVYTYRSRYFDADSSGSTSLRPIDPATATTGIANTDTALQTVPLVTYVRPAGRLDFNVGFDVNKALRFDFGGTNILRNRTESYYGFGSLMNIDNSINYDETTYTAGVRVRF